MELIEQAQGQLKELKVVLDEATGCIFPTSIVAMICEEFVTNEAYLLEAILLHMCWEKHPPKDDVTFRVYKRYGKFVSDLKERLHIAANDNCCKTIRNYLNDVEKYVPWPKFREAVDIDFDPDVPEPRCHRLLCFYRSSGSFCVCGDPIRPRIS